MRIKRLRTSGRGDAVGLSVAGNCVTLLHDPETCLPSMIDAIEDAEHEICIEMYWFASDRTGWEFANTLCERARAGVHVHVIYDAVGSITADDAMFHQMQREGCQVAEYNPVAPWRRRFDVSRLNNRDHRKMVVLDGRIAFVGGVNLGDEWASVARGGGGYRDDVVKIEGPAAGAVREVFEHTWQDLTGVTIAGGAPAPAVGFSRGPRRQPPNAASHDPNNAAQAEAAPVDPSSGSPVRVLANHYRDERKAIRQAYLSRIQRAQRYVYVTNSYFVPDRKVRQSLMAAARRGVDVRVLLPIESDVPVVDHASRWLWRALLGSGVRLYGFRGPILHAKSAVSDDIWTTVGSFNFDNRSWHSNLEVNLAIEDDALAQAMRSRFMADLNESVEISAEKHANRRLWLRFIDWLCFLFRALL